MACRAHPDGRYLQADLRALPFAAFAFDLAYARDSIIHTPDPVIVLRELRRVESSVLLRLRIAPSMAW
jgi:ubiquinone/menaquinone biosynthesis C-methylase UbiE